MPSTASMLICLCNPLMKIAPVNDTTCETHIFSLTGKGQSLICPLLKCLRPGSDQQKVLNRSQSSEAFDGLGSKVKLQQHILDMLI